jgi:hypothetical protein
MAQCHCFQEAFPDATGTITTLPSESLQHPDLASYPSSPLQLTDEYLAVLCLPVPLDSVW